MPSPWHRLLPALLTATLLLAGCSDDEAAEDQGGGAAEPADPATDETDATSSVEDDPGAIASSVGACDLVTETDLVDAGLEIVSGPTVRDAGYDLCEYEIRAGDANANELRIAYYPARLAEQLGPETYPEAVLLDGPWAEAWFDPELRVMQARLESGRMIEFQETRGILTQAELTTLLEVAAGRT